MRTLAAARKPSLYKEFDTELGNLFEETVLQGPRTPTLQGVISDDLNYEVWSAMMKTILKEKGLWDVVENGVPPDPSKFPESASSLQVEELCKWRGLVRKDMKALQILQSSLPDSVFRMTLSAASAKDLWDMVHVVPEMVTSFLGDLPFDEDLWYISSTTNHMSPYEKYFTTLDRTYRAEVRLVTGGSIVMAEGIGDVSFMTGEVTMTIKNVLYVPKMTGNELSASQMERNGYTVGFDTGAQICKIWERATRKIFGDKCMIWQRATTDNFGETKWKKKGFFLRLRVIEGNIQSKKRKIDAEQ